MCRSIYSNQGWRFEELCGSWTQLFDESQKNVRHTGVLNGLKRIGNVKKIDETFHILRLVLLCSCATKTTFFGTSLTCDAKWCIIIESVGLYLDKAETPKLFPKSKTDQERSWLPYGGRQLVSSTANFLKLARLLQQRHTVGKSTKCVGNYASSLHWSTEGTRFSYTISPVLNACTELSFTDYHIFMYIANFLLQNLHKSGTNKICIHRFYWIQTVRLLLL